MKTSNATFFLVSCLTGTAAASFVDASHGKSAFLRSGGGGGELKSYAPSRHEFESGYLFQDFTTSDGERIDPYEILQLDRTANRMDIKKNYRMLSKLFHPDGVRFADSLPANWYVLLIFHKNGCFLKIYLLF